MRVITLLPAATEIVAALGAADRLVAQALCEVCAVADGQVHRLGAMLPSAPRVLSLSGRSLAGLWIDIGQVGRELDLGDEAEELVLGLQYRPRPLRGHG